MSDEERARSASSADGVQSRAEADLDESASHLPQDTAYESLEPSVVWLWRLESLIFFGILFGAVLGGGGSLWWLTKTPAWVVLGAWVLVGFLFFLNVFWLPPLKYAAWSYRADEQSLELCFGIFWQRSVRIPLSRIQHVDTNRGPLERRFGLVSLRVHTAGTSSASHEIPGLEYETGLRLREHLIRSADLCLE